MRELIERLEKAEAGSRELDAALWYALVEKPALGEKRDRDMIGRWPAYTTSLDAALALAEGVLPGWSRGVFEDEPGNQPPWLATLTEVCDARAVEEHEGAGATAPLALCAAILKAPRRFHLAIAQGRSRRMVSIDGPPGRPRYRITANGLVRIKAPFPVREWLRWAVAVARSYADMCAIRAYRATLGRHVVRARMAEIDAAIQSATGEG